MREWPTIKLKDIAILITKGTTPSTIGGGFQISGINFIKSESLSYDGQIDKTRFAKISNETHQQLKRSQIKENDILYSIAGINLGKCGLAKAEYLPANTNQAVAIIRVNKEIANPKFVHFYLRNSAFVRQVNSGTAQSAQPNVNLADIGNFNLTIPDIAEQKAIAAVLGALDDKIELNRRMNATLEGMARALFKSWFVDFDPVRAKMEGKQPFGMDAATAALFPSRLVPSPLGDIPEGWAVDEIGNAVTAVGGSTPSTERPEYWVDGHHAWATPKDLSSLKSPVLLSTERQITDAGISVISSGLLPAGTVLMSSRAPIGYIAIPEVPVAINQGFIAMVCNKKLPNLYVWLWTHSNLETIKNHSNGSTFQEISKGSFRPLPCIIPTDPVLKKFEEIMSPIWQKIVFNTKETIKLEKQRDYLLPKLISGDIRIPDVEKLLEAAC